MTYVPTFPATSVRAAEAPDRYRVAVQLRMGRRAHDLGWSAAEITRYSMVSAGAIRRGFMCARAAEGFRAGRFVASQPPTLVDRLRAALRGRAGCGNVAEWSDAKVRTVAKLEGLR